MRLTSNHPVDLDAPRCVRIHSVKGHLGAANDGDLGRRRERIIVLDKVLAVKDWSTKSLLPFSVRQVRNRRQARGDNELLRQDLALGRVRLDRQDPAAFLPVLGRNHLVIKPDLVDNVKLLGIHLQVPMDDLGGDVLPRLDAKSGRVHWEIGILVRAQQVVTFEAGVQTVLSPDATDGGRGVEDEHRVRGVELVVRLGLGEAEPSCCCQMVFTRMRLAMYLRR